MVCFIRPTAQLDIPPRMLWAPLKFRKRRQRWTRFKKGERPRVLEMEDGTDSRYVQPKLEESGTLRGWTWVHDGAGDPGTEGTFNVPDILKEPSSFRVLVRLPDLDHILGIDLLEPRGELDSQLASEFLSSLGGVERQELRGVIHIWIERDCKLGGRQGRRCDSIIDELQVACLSCSWGDGIVDPERI